MIKDRLRLNLVEVDAHRFGRVEGADDAAAADSRQLTVIRVRSLGVPAHEHMFANGPDGLVGVLNVPRGLLWEALRDVQREPALSV